jgi:anti-sigma-K factor RskA
MSPERIDELAALYAAGALDGEEREEFERLLAGGDVAAVAALRANEEALAGLARLAPPTIPPPEVKQALLARVAMEGSGEPYEGAPPIEAPPARARRASGWLRWGLATAAAVVAAAWFTGAWVATRYEARLGQMARELAALRGRVARDEQLLREQLALYQGALDLLRDPATRVVALRGLGPRPGASGRVIWHATAGGHLVVAGLPPAPAGKAYELWTIGTGAPRPAGLFQADASGRASHRVAPVAEPVKVFAVTLEPEAGVPAPTGPMVLASK